MIFGVAYNTITELYNIINKRYDGKVLVINEELAHTKLKTKKYKVLLIDSFHSYNLLCQNIKLVRPIIVIFDFDQYLKQINCVILDDNKTKSIAMNDLIKSIEQHDYKKYRLVKFEYNLLEKIITEKNENDFFRFINDIIYVNFANKNRDKFRKVFATYMLDNKPLEWLQNQTKLLMKGKNITFLDAILKKLETKEGKQLISACKFYKNKTMPKKLPKKYNLVFIFDLQNILYYYK